MMAAVHGKFESVKLLIRRRPFIDRMPFSDGWTALTLAAHSGHYPIVRYLLECGASAVPPAVWGKWKNFKFNHDVSSYTQSNILEALREYKHR
jgi:ankyrin repeat protein